ncbi:GrpB family protein [Providencia rettgeri]|nr:GrpB family protein [Providencia rettgeri]EJD6641543.1 GrpB family protein [Providencia rettgeri]ELL9152909.1 GrpB family protein [Providencia rettgeri]ELR5047756.1 GrpB family protein [Providencia rettgeri]ELR5061371.1 GrpB family protein [Providencia rettgeri]
MDNSKRQYYKKHLEQITSFQTSNPNENPWVLGKPKTEIIDVVDYDPNWQAKFKQIKQNIQNKLGHKALAIEHVGSTAVSGLSAKPVIDIDLIVKNPEQELNYAPILEEFGFLLTVREPSWYQHRMFRLEQPRVNLHVFGPDCPEHLRHILFRDWLRTHADDRRLYEEAKKMASVKVTNVQVYNQNKENVIKEIYDKIIKTISE